MTTRTCWSCGGRDLLCRVISFFERNPFVSCKQQELLTFARMVREMEAGMHLSPGGFDRLAAEALGMNGGGRYRRLHCTLTVQNPQRPHAEPLRFESAG